MPVKRLPALFALLLLARPAFCQDAPQLHITGGDSIVVKIDKVIIVKEDRLVVRSLPFKINASPGAADYRWSIPAGVTATENDDVLHVTAAPKGEYTVSCRVLVVDFSAKATKRTTESLTFNVGDVTPPEPIPVVPPPVSSLQRSLQAAYTADADPDGAVKLASLSELLGSVVGVAKASKKMAVAKDFTTYVDNAVNLHPKIGKGSLPLTERAIGAYLSKAMAPALASTPCDEAYWEKAGAAYAAVADALKGVK